MDETAAERRRAARRAAIIRGKAGLAREELAAADYPALADAVRDNAETLARHQVMLEGLDFMMKATVEAAGLAEPPPRTRHLRVVRSDEAS